MNSSLGRLWIASLSALALAACGSGDSGTTASTSGATGGGGAAASTSASGNGGSPSSATTSAGTTTGAATTTGAGGTTGAGASTGVTTGSSGSGGGAPKVEPYVYVGGYTNLIHVFHLNVADGSLEPVGAPVAAGTNPSYLAVDPGHHTLLAVNEDSGGKGAVASFHIDSSTGELTFKSRVSSMGDGPAFVSTDHTGAFAFVANYNGGTVAVLPLASDGVLGDAIDVHNHGGSANPHQLITGPSNAFAFVPNKGLDTVTQYAFNAASGKLTAPSTLTVASKAGPRHLAFHPTSPYAYLIDELDSTMSALAYDAGTGKLASLQTVSTLPAGFQGQNTGAEVQVAPSGNFVYGSNRGHDSIVVFHVEAGGKLKLVAHQATLGQTPRHFQIEATGQLLLVANQGSGTVVTFRVDASTGALTPTGKSVNVDSPSYVGVVYLSAP